MRRIFKCLILISLSVFIAAFLIIVSACNEQSNDQEVVDTKVTCNHDWNINDCEINAICSICGETNTKTYSHTYVGTCGEFGTCSRCGKISDVTISHSWKGNNKTGIIRCTKCKETVTYAAIKEKGDVSKLTDPEKAFLYWELNNYLTAVNKNGKYTYTISEAFNKVAQASGLSSTTLENSIWNNYGNFKLYSKYYT
jgi:hypothetical protein